MHHLLLGMCVSGAVVMYGREGEDAYLHLPVGHVVRAVLHPPEDVFYLWWKNVAILRT